jgi:NADH-quinone oxidoreductase subunit M
MMGAFKANPTVAFFSVFGIILSAGYALWLYARVIYGKLEKPNLQGILDLDLREKIIIAPLVALTIYYGVHPAPILDTFAPSTEALMQSMKTALSNTQAAAVIPPVAR